MSQQVFKIAVVAGEASSDMIGASLISDLLQLNSGLEIIAVGGKHISATGVKIIQHNEIFSIMGLAEVIKDLPRLLKAKKQIVKSIEAFKPDLFIGIDSPDLNFSIAKSLKKSKIPVVHYVSPSVWAWRPKRVYQMQKFIDHLLTLFPFEVDIYVPTSIKAQFVGHPLAQKIPVDFDKAPMKVNIQAKGKKVLALLPGSRSREIKTLMPVFAATIQKMNLSNDWQIISSNVSDEKIKLVNSTAAEHGLQIDWVEDATELLKAADFALLGSGTVALEAMLCKTPMVVAYQISKITWWIVNTFKMMQLPYYSLPNVLHGDFLVPEVMQNELTVDRLVDVCDSVMQQSDHTQLINKFEQLHQDLLPQQPDQAARAVMHVLEDTC